MGTHLSCIYVKAIQMGTHNICLYTEVDKKYTGSNLESRELVDSVFRGKCSNQG